ncbi:Multiple coagulation factor deficiency protein 2 [Bulinus truncatus]|nr:Multiple coagulation factor deficiency protein 2 [Bulinus truncatus]
MKMHLAVLAVTLILVQESIQQPPGVPPKQEQHGHQQQQQPPQPSGHGHGEGHGAGHGHGQSLEFASEIHNRDHILEHLNKVVSTKPKDQMTEEELEFHYFKLHDYDNNNKLDGVEIGKALTHYHEENEKDQQEQPKIFGDSEISNIVDSVILENDENNDGYIEYFEFKRRQSSSRDQREQPPPPPHQP